MAHVLHRITRHMKTSLRNRHTSRHMDAALRDPHLAKDIGLPPVHHVTRKPEQW